jgi:dipeptidyl aminopeptidase/acylaminoacyl peptidase
MRQPAWGGTLWKTLVATGLVAPVATRGVTVCASASEPARQPVSLDDVLASWEGASEPDLSADGRRIVYADEGSVWLIDLPGAESRRLTEGETPRWSPMGDEIAFLRGQPAQVWLRDQTGKERPLARSLGGPPASGLPLPDFSWSPDGRHIATISPLEEPAATDSQKTTDTIVEVHHRRLPPGLSLSVTDVTTGESHEVARTEPGVAWPFSPAWSPDGRRMALIEDVFLATGGEEETRLAILDLETGRMRYPAGHGKRQVISPQWSPDGTRLAFPYSPHEFMSPTRMVCGIMTAAGGEIKCLANDYVIRSVCWHPDNRTLYCLGNRGNTTQILRLDTITGKVQPLTDAPGIHRDLRLSADGKWLVCTYSTPSTLAEVYLLSTDGHERRQLTHVSDRLNPFRLAETELVRWKAPDGLQIEGVLVKPLNYEPGHRYPAIVDLHGGPEGGVWLGFHPEWHWLAAHGYLVFAPDYRASQLYRWCTPPADGPESYRDLMAGVDWLVAQGYADPDRLGVRGFSAGAWLTTWTVGHTHRFKAAIVEGVRCHAEIDYGIGWGPGGNAILAGTLGGRPWEVPDVYRRNSPLTYIPHARTPSLILQGERDMLVEAEMLYTWLHQAGVEVEFVKYLGEGHTIQKREHRADCWLRNLAWFDRHLQRHGER